MRSAYWRRPVLGPAQAVQSQFEEAPLKPDEWRLVGEAILVWSGWGKAPSPVRDD